MHRVGVRAEWTRWEHWYGMLVSRVGVRAERGGGAWSLKGTDVLVCGDAWSCEVACYRGERPTPAQRLGRRVLYGMRCVGAGFGTLDGKVVLTGAVSGDRALVGSGG